MAPNSPTTGQVAAKSLVQSIALEHGYIREAVYARMDSDMRREVRAAMGAKDKLIGSSAMLLARELYSKDVRFIFELLQNADDNTYSNATSAPYAAFYLFHKKVIVECNEDGFTEAHLRAICSIGNSSKVSNHGYTGEKGIGFKSVFKVAWKAHIQSGDFSFSFTHQPGDSGMGMISPEWEGFSKEPSRQQTRITLYLIDDDQATIRYESIARQLRELESTMLLFLRRLKRIDVRIYNGDDVEVSATALAVSMDEKVHKASLQRIHTQDGTSETTRTYCHVTKHLATGLAKSDNRTYTEGQDSRSYSTADVILAFPISEDSTPIVEAQQVFAFLPIRRLGFNFLIQTDFVTMANREDIVSSSSRNLALLDNVADAFIKAIHQMYNHETLRYQWMRYLRNMKTYPWEAFWKRLVEKIENRLATAEILEPRRRGSPRIVSDLKPLTRIHCDMDGNPLFEDLPGRAEKYISTDYRDDDLQILRDFGIKYMAQDASYTSCGKWAATDINLGTLRDAFESEALIFLQDNHADYLWVKPSECLWSTATDIRNRITLNKYYDDVLEDFFVTALGVSRVTIDMIYDELYTADRANVTLEHVKSLLSILCTLLETEKLKPTQTAAKLLERAILPVRIATHLRSPRARSSDQVQTFYALLLKTETWETNGISATLILAQDGLHTTVELEQGEVCIDDKGDMLNIYVPRDEESQDVCFGSALPEKLVEWMATDPTTLQIDGSMAESMVKVVTGVLGTRSPSAMQRILDMQGIVDIDVAIEPPVVALEQTDQSRTGTAIDEPNRPQHQEESITFSIRSRSNSTSSSTLANEFAMR
ncbi:hypothetical protein PLICBS_000043 [Purpureocillium lilacinum]|uniref:uncharacterized protein n=1 Tax=Purpureocillium lilacinum TaxID=33203 RepID=UPI002082C5C9|nr:hypothetical protein PLICBS_000043 [Purpureocillium lilacinum]